jgi:hypothetical protein
MFSIYSLLALSSVSQVLVADLDATRAQTETALAGIGRIVAQDKCGILRVQLDRAMALPLAEKTLKQRGIEYVMHTEAPLRRTTNWGVAQRLRYQEAKAALRLGRKPKLKEITGASSLAAYQDWLSSRTESGANPLSAAMRDAAVAHRAAMPEALMVRPREQLRTTVGPWSYVGPKLTDTGFLGYGSGPHSGRKNGIAPSEQNPFEVIYTASAEGGVWKTNDGGLSWTPLSDDWQFLGTNCIAVNPGNDNVVLVGTGDYDWDRAEHFGVMLTTDGGTTWINVPKSTFNDLQIRKIIWDPESPNIAIALASSDESDVDGGIYHTTTWGLTWTLTNAPAERWDDIDKSVYDPSVGYRTYYAVAGSSDVDGHIYKSTDRGLTWTAATSPPTGATQKILDVACSKLDPDRIYVVCPGSDQVFRSNDGGVTWNDKTAGFVNTIQSGIKDNWDQDDYDIYIETSYEGSNDVVYVGLITLVGSPDGGNTWRDLSLSYESNSLAHADQQCLAVAPGNPRYAYAGNDGGIYLMFWDSRFVIPGAPLVVSFAPRNETLYDFLTTTLAVHPTNSDFLMAGQQDMGTQASRGNLNDWTTLLGGDASWPAFEVNQPKFHYVTSQRLGSIDAFSTRFSTNPVAIENPSFDAAGDTAFVAPLIAAGASGSALYVGALRQLWTYDRTAGIAGWTQIATSFADLGVIEQIAAAPSAPWILYVGNAVGKVYLYDSTIATAIELTDLTGAIGCIAVHPTDPYRIFVGTKNAAGPFYECLDTQAGRASVFTDKRGIGPNLPASPITAVCYDPFHSDTWYVGTDEGLYKTVNAGTTWSHMTGLPNVPVSRAAVGPGTYLYAATRGRGVWRATLFQIQIATINPNLIDLFGGDDLGFDVELFHFTDRVIRIPLRDDSPDIHLPEDIPVPPGLYSARVNVPTLAVEQRRQARIEASWNGKRVQARVNLYPKPPIAAFQAQAAQVTGGQPVQFRVGFANRLPADAMILIDDDSDFLQAPESIVIPRGERFGTFTAITRNVPSPQVATVRVRFGNSMRTLPVTIRP